MAIFRVHKTKNFTTINNYLIKDERLSLKDKGMMLVLLSLPDNWNFSVKGLETICKEARNTINSILNDLEKNEYLERNMIYENGKIKEWKYDIYEIPKNLYRKNEDIENEDIQNETQLNTKETNTKKQNTKHIGTHTPTLEEIKDYCLNVRHNKVDYKKFYDYFTEGNWFDSKGNKVKNWKQKIITWEKNTTDKKEFEYEKL